MVVLASATALAGPPSNPAFLGISMEDARVRSANDGCRVVEVTPMSSAEAAGLHQYDIIIALDAVPTASCQQLSAEIIAHAPGDVVHLDVIRAGERMTARAALTTRAEILHRRLVGRPLDSAEATDVDDRHQFDLSELRGDTTILAWFDVKRCGNCVSLIRRLGDIVQAPRKSGTAPNLIAITSGTPDDLAGYRTTVNLGVPLAAVDAKTFERAATLDGDRVFVMVLDRRGHVCFVTPIAPEDDSLDAAIDEVLAAAEQAEYARVRR